MQPAHYSALFDTINLSSTSLLTVCTFTIARIGQSRLRLQHFAGIFGLTALQLRGGVVVVAHLAA